MACIITATDARVVDRVDPAGPTPRGPQRAESDASSAVNEVVVPRRACLRILPAGFRGRGWVTILIQGLTFVLQAFLIIVLIRVVFSFVSPFPTNPLSRLAWQVTEPVLAPIRRLLPPMGGIDLSPMVVGIGAIILISVLNNLAGP